MNTERKIEILENIKERLIKQNFDHYVGLCGLINEACTYPNEHSLNIELFTYSNAIKHGNVIPDNYPPLYWWNVGSAYDYKNRTLFLDWMINEYKKTIEK